MTPAPDHDTAAPAVPYDLLDGLVRLVERTATGMRASILLLGADRVTLRHGAAPSLPDAYNGAIDRLRIGPTVGSCGTAAYRRKRVIVSDIARDPLWADFRALAAEHGLAACWSTPVFDADGELLGTFAMYYDAPRAPTPDDEESIGIAARMAAAILELGERRRVAGRSG